MINFLISLEGNSLHYKIIRNFVFLLYVCAFYLLNCQKNGNHNPVAPSNQNLIVFADDFSSLHEAIDHIGVNPALLIIKSNENLSMEDTINQNITLQFVKGGTISLGGFNLIIKGTIQSGFWQIFNYSGSGSVYIEPGSVHELFPQWWGENNERSIQSAFDAAIYAKADVIFIEGIYEITEPIRITLPSETTQRIIGNGNVKIISTISEPTELDGIFDIAGSSNSNLVIQDISIIYNSTKRGLLSGINLRGEFNNVVLRNLRVSKSSFFGVRIEKAQGGNIENCHLFDNRYGGLGFICCENFVVTG